MLPAQRVRPGVLDADGDLATDQVGAAGEVDELVAAASGRTGAWPRPSRTCRVIRRVARLDLRVGMAVAAGGVTVSTRTSTSRPSQASLRSSPIPSWTASSSLSRRRLTSGGTSSARCVAGVPGRGE